MKKWKNQPTWYKVLWITSLVILIATVVIILCYVGLVHHIFSLSPVGEPIVQVSPDGTKQLVIQEYSGLGGVHGADVYISANSNSAIWNRLTRIKVGSVSGISHSTAVVYGSWAGDQQVKVGILADGRRKSKTFDVPAVFRSS